jgi:hypothetical protein
MEADLGAKEFGERLASRRLEGEEEEEEETKLSSEQLSI